MTPSSFNNRGRRPLISSPGLSLKGEERRLGAAGRLKRPLVIAGVYDALSALLAKKAGFEMLYLSGGALSVSLLGKPDIGLLTMDDVVGTAKRIVEATQRPLLVDADTGFGGELNIRRTVQALERVGAAGVQIEDQTFPKRCGHLRGKEVIPAAEMVKKIKAACQARKNRRFLIVARTDARGVTDFSDALKRAQLYHRAGADIIFPEALQSEAEFRRFGAKKKLGPLMANMTEFGRSPALSAAELARLGFRLVLFPMTAFRSAAHAMEKTLKKLKKQGQSASFLGQLQSRRDLYKLIQYNAYDRLEKTWSKGLKK